jgi:hypothetical protein
MQTRYPDAKELNCITAPSCSHGAVRSVIAEDDGLRKSHCEVPEAPCLSRVAGLWLIRLRSV